MLNIGPQELLIILVIALIFVGPAKLPELSRTIGKGLREFRKVQDDVKGMVKFDLDDTPERATPKAATPTSPRTAAGPHRTARPAPATPPAVNGSGATGATPAADADPGTTAT